MTLVHHHLGLGDHFICNAIVHHLHRKYGDVHCVTKRTNEPTVRALYRGTGIGVFPVDDDFFSVPPGAERIKIGFDDIDMSNFEESFYHIVGLDPSVRFTGCVIPRHEHREYAVRRYCKPIKFVLVIDTCSEGKFDLKVETDLPVVRMTPMTDNLLDWLMVIEDAYEIHTIDTSVFHLIRNMQLKTPKTIHYVPGRPHRYALDDTWTSLVY